jgi:acetyl/propionyl-CoA carboxylase alpha subunit
MEPPMKFRAVGGNREFEVEILSRDGAAIRLRIDGEEVSAEIERASGGDAILRIDGRRIPLQVVRRRESILVAAGPAAFEFVRVEGRGARGGRGLATPEVIAPMPGKVLKVLVSEGQAVEGGQPLIVLEAMKMETTLYAESGATVRKVHATIGAMVDHGVVLIELSPTDSSNAEAVPRDG